VQDLTEKAIDAAVAAGAGYAADKVSLAAAGTMIAVAFVIGTAAGGRLWREATGIASEGGLPVETPGLQERG